MCKSCNHWRRDAADDQPKIVRKRLPKRREPRKLERKMARELTAIVRTIQSAFKEVLSLRVDDYDARIEMLKRSVMLKAKGTEEKAAGALASLAAEVGEHVTKEQIQIIRNVLGIAPDFYNQEQIAGVLDSWKTTNRAFITKFTNEEIDRAMGTVSDGFREGRSTRDIQKKLAKDFGISMRRAKTIARTEISQLNSAVVQQRDNELGLTKYVWRTSKDERVRGRPGGKYPNAVPSHWDREGMVFEWANPPEGGHPGEAINCRCYAEPYFDDLL